MEDETNPHPNTNAPDSDERVRFALGVARMGVFEWNPNSDRLTWSSGTTGLGLNQEEAPTSGREFFELVHPDDRQRIRDTRERAIRDHTDAVSEFRILSPNGVVHWVQAHGRVEYDTDGTPLRILGVNIDITDRKRLEDELLEARLQAEQVRVLRATMRTVQDIVNNFLNGLQLLRIEAEGCVTSDTLTLFDKSIQDTAAQLTALGDMEAFAEKPMATGPGLDAGAPPASR